MILFHPDATSLANKDKDYWFLKDNRLKAGTSKVSADQVSTKSLVVDKKRKNEKTIFFKNICLIF